MHSVIYFFVLVSFLGHFVATPVVARLDPVQVPSVNSKTSPSPPSRISWDERPYTKFELLRQNKFPVDPASSGNGAIRVTPQKHSPSRGSPGQRPAASSQQNIPRPCVSGERGASNTSGKLNPKTNIQRRCSANQGPSNIDLVAYYLRIPRDLIQQNCPTTPPESSKSGFNGGPTLPPRPAGQSPSASGPRLAQKPPLRRPERFRKVSKRGKERLSTSQKRPHSPDSQHAPPPDHHHEGPSTSKKRPHSPDSGHGTPPKYRKRVFLGYRGTTSNVAQAYRKNGLVNAPANGHLSALGEGLYLTDDLRVAHSFATGSTNMANQFGVFTSNSAAIPVRPSICTIFAEDESYFRDSIHKVFLPPSAWADEVIKLEHGSPESHAYQFQWIQQNIPELSQIPNTSIVKFSNIFPSCPSNPTAPNQILIPRELLLHFSIGSCIDYNVCRPAPDFGLPTLRDPANKLDYREKYQAWSILGRHDDDPVAEPASTVP